MSDLALFQKPPPKSVIMWKSLESVLNDSTTFLLNSFDVLRVHLAPSLINALAIILPDVNPSQSIWVVIEIDLLDLIQSEILSLNNDSDFSNVFCHYSNWATTDLYFHVLGILSILL